MVYPILLQLCYKSRYTAGGLGGHTKEKQQNENFIS